ncbi:single-stranded-DNA-specific exonuclease RecJ [Hymenobacter sp. UV11]|uniref:single-stranded-DNA-specific exonuclease RecJ n=1 Tax=Hymenobacter sp. UV11 TaxID=1849735 RepID=UPI001061CB25|nr:single-stranded-DNA-specific exonuclease RecJ [Hymenobacter sp. UV11]TDN39998.1 single-stranded-DNA-specific exonuclease RecJ [Hymenobacter sp. UV11]TFZ64091.1 single-stranded-DNA-specific exonuclease RecJ [Hymenobacter sp. UV11]
MAVIPLKRWILAPEPDPATVAGLVQALGISPVLAQLLVQRGIETPAAARDFFEPDLAKLASPWLMCDMDLAVARVRKALDGGERILVLGDYDVDGITSVALVVSFLRSLIESPDTADEASRFQPYIPDRHREGYGISMQAVDFAKENGLSLIIALDCGVKAVEQVAYANTQGVDFVICDHHLPGEVLPPAVAVLDPKRLDCTYPYPDLSGCGVGFKLLQALTEKLNLPLAPLYAQLDLVTVSIAADVVPVTGENRILAAHGLRRFNVTQAAAFAVTQPSALASADTLDGPAPLAPAPADPATDGLRPGLAALHELATPRQGPLTLSSLVFGFAPRINAAGRMGDAHRAVNMLLASTQQEARYTAEVVDHMNQERRLSDARTTQEALALIAEDPEGATSPATVLYQAHWPQGVLGIVASRCLDQYYRPTVILTERDGMATGSARSVAGFDVHAVLEACAPLLRQFGGHKAAAGLALPIENVPAFREQFMREVAARLPAGQHPVRPVDIDAVLDFTQLTEDFLGHLALLEPYGPGNPAPVFASRGLRAVPGSVRPVGQAGHLKIRLMQPEQSPGLVLEGIGFGLGHYLPRLLEAPDATLSACYVLEMNEFRGQRSLQLRLLDLRWE